GYNCIAGHCNFHLRGEDSDRDAAFVSKWCSDNNIPFFSIDFDTNEYAASNKISIEMAARELRYDWFEKLRVEQSADVVAVGHHQDDSVETILINLIRGTGIKGLTGIPLVNKHIVRPLLTVTRRQIMEYLSDNKVPYVIDHTNEEELYTRNILRLNVLPTLEKINPSVKNSIVATANNLKEAEKIYDGYISSAIETVYDGKKIDIKKLKQTYSPQSVLFEILSPMGFTSSVIEDISNNLDSIPGKIYFADKIRLLKDRDYLVLSDESEECSDREYLIYADAVDKNFPFDLTITTEEYTSQFEIQKNKAILHCDIDKLTFPLTLRRWRKGDWFVPFGMKGKKKLSDFFSDSKFSLFEKEEAWILLSGNSVIWILNHRADNRFRITEATKTVYTIKLGN
ncbi:MAG: tRNA lysidine(34) synthetase TilS, partial [Bacteroidales bacterium]|nr:tRNA lysidine(34) synthetase TilS [Bacteroidales bacterium]